MASRRVGLAETSAALNDLDLVAVRVGDEEEARDRLAILPEVQQRTGRQFLALETIMLGVDVVDDDGKVAKSVAERIGLRAREIDREPDLECRPWIAQVDQRETRKGHIVGNQQPERPGIEIEPSFLIQDADHRMGELCHSRHLLENSDDRTWIFLR